MKRLPHRFSLPRLSPATLICIALLATLPCADDPAQAAPPQLVELTVQPETPVLTGARAVQRLLVSGQMDDGRPRDVTPQCRFESANPRVVTVTDEGVVHPVANGTATVFVHLGDRTVESQVTVERVENDSFNFANHVLPVLSRSKCNQMGCHGSPKGKNGFRLSLFGADPQADYRAIARNSYGRLVQAVEPDKSLLLLKGTTTIPHGGGERLIPDSPEHRTLIAWIAQGAPQGSADDPRLERIEVIPERRVLAAGERQSLLVQAYYNDGSVADVSQLADFTSNDDLIATASPEGRVEATGSGEAIVMVGYGGHVATSRFLIPRATTPSIDDAPANNRIDELVMAKLRSLNIAPSELCSDAEFLRRVYLDVLGVLPTPDEARAFLVDASADKRSRLIDALLERDEYVDRWTVKWCDLLRVNRDFPSNLGDRPMWAYYYWVREQVARNTPMDQFVQELLTASGNAADQGAANFFRVARDPQSMAEQASALFLGVRLDCAQCHNHPFERLTWNDNLGLSAFFARVQRKRRSEAEGTEAIYEGARGTFRHPETREVVAPRFLDGASLEPGAAESDESLRLQLAQWMTSPENPWFARNMANRVWYWLLGRGIVHEPDDFRSTNPPSNPALLDYLAEEFVATGFDTKHLFRLILNSRTYQLSSQPNGTNADDHVHFSHYPLRRLDAEQMLDALSQATGTPERFPGLPTGMRAAQTPDPAVRSLFLDLFGRPQRSSACECERTAEMHVGQTLHLISSDHVEGKLAAGNNRLGQLLSAGKTDEQIIEELYLATYSRFPTDAERGRAPEPAATPAERRQWFEDLHWALLNSKEFLFNH